MGWEETGAKYVEVKDLSGGLNSNKYVHEIDDNESTDCNNVYYHDGALRKMYGYTAFDSTAVVADEITGLYDFHKFGGNQYLVATCGTKCKHGAGAGWTDITGTETITADLKFSMIDYYDTLVLTNGTDLPFKWTGAGNIAQIGAGAIPKGKYCTNFYNFLMFGNCDTTHIGGTTYPTRIYYNDGDGAIDTWTPATNFLEFETEDGQEITGLRQLGNKLVVYMNRSISLLSFAGGTLTTAWRPNADVVKGIGPINGHVIQTGHFIDDGGNITFGHIWLGSDGYLYGFNGDSIVNLTRKNKTWIEDNLDYTKISKAVAVYYKDLGQYICLIPQTGSLGFVYDTLKRAFWPISGYTGTALATRYVNNRESLLMGTSVGKVNILGPSYTTMAGASITGYWWSKWYDLGDASQVKLFRNAMIHLMTKGNYTLQVNVAADLDNTTNGMAGTVSMHDGSPTYGTATYPSTYSKSGVLFDDIQNIIKDFRYIRLRLYNAEAIDFEVHKFGFYFMPMGQRPF